jgi:hypothetical protein
LRLTSWAPSNRTERPPDGQGEYQIGDSYVRVLEIPTPRWTTYDAARNNLVLLPDVPATVQERAWTSPIWYNPS